MNTNTVNTNSYLLWIYQALRIRKYGPVVRSTRRSIMPRQCENNFTYMFTLKSRRLGLSLSRLHGNEKLNLAVTNLLARCQRPPPRFGVCSADR